MKKLSVCLAAVLLTLCCAAAAAELIVQVSQPDGAMLGAGDYAFDFTLYNAGSERIDAIGIYSGGSLLSKYGAVGSDESIECTVTDTVSEAELDDGVKAFTVRYISGGAKSETAVRTVVERDTPDARLSVTRFMPKDGFFKDEACVIAYRIENTGNVAFTGLTVTDAAGGYTGGADRLEPGETIRLVNRFAISGDTVSEPEFSAVNAWDGSVYTEKLPAGPLTVGTASIDVRITASDENAVIGHKALLSAMITNTGTLDLENVSLTGAYIGPLYCPEDGIPAGGSIEIEREIEIRDTTTFSLTVTARTGRGALVEAMSDPVTVTCMPDESIREIYLEAEPKAEALIRKGDMPVDIRVKSASGAEIRNVDIMEETLGVIRHLDIVAGTEPTEFTVTVPVEKKTDFMLYAVGDDAEESARIAFTVAISDKGLAPDGKQSVPERFSLFTLPFGWVLALALVSLAVLLALLIVSALRENKEKKRKAARKRQAFIKYGNIRKVRK